MHRIELVNMIKIVCLPGFPSRSRGHIHCSKLQLPTAWLVTMKPASNFEILLFLLNASFTPAQRVGDDRWNSIKLSTSRFEG